MWTMETLASEVVDAHRKLLLRVNPSAADQCPGLLWCDGKIAANPNVSVGELLRLGAQDVASGVAQACWPHDLLLGQMRRFSPDVRAAILRILPVNEVRSAAEHMKALTLTDDELRAIAERGA